MYPLVDHFFKIFNFLQFSPKISSFHRIYPNIVKALDMKKISQAPFYNLEHLRSRNGSKFVSFAKSSAFKKELYVDLVAPHYKAGDFFVESWRHGPGNIGSDCSRPRRVYNIEDISIKGSKKINFSTQHDHSKWMVSNDNSLICVGDINRQEHQKVRGGGTVCIELESVAKVYSQSIVDSEPCTKRNRHFSGETRNNHVRNDVDFHF